MKDRSWKREGLRVPVATSGGVFRFMQIRRQLFDQFKEKLTGQFRAVSLFLFCILLLSFNISLTVYFHFCNYTLFTIKEWAIIASKIRQNKTYV